MSRVAFVKTWLLSGMALCAIFSFERGIVAQDHVVGAFRGEPFTSTVDEVRAAAAAVPVDPEFGVQVLLEEGTYRISADGRLLYRYRMIFRVDGKDSVEGWSEASIGWDPWYEQPAQIHARVLQADGKFLELDQKTITDAPVKGEDAETYSSERERRAPLPGVSVGTIVEEVEEVEEKTPYFAAGGVYRFRFQRPEPVARARVIVDMPASMPFKDVLLHAPSVAVERGDGGDKTRRHMVYEKVGTVAGRDSDIDLTTNDPMIPMLTFATGESWKSVATSYALLADPQTVVEEAKTILPGTLPPDREGRIRAVVAKLHAEVRYTGVEFGAAKLTPQRPSEVIKRHYGDCKDKATLLVAMLRAAGVPANLALLDTGPGLDVDDGLPGMTQFDHAVVYVPAAGKKAALWIDATAQYFAPGSLPFEDEGRRALVIAPETVGLTMTPMPAATDSVLVETRTFTLAEFGPAHVVETSDTRGVVDATYRTLYGGPDTKKVRAELEGYVSSAYLAKTLVKVSHGASDDLSKPFDLTLEMDHAKRGNTALNEATVVIFPMMVTQSLPRWFILAPDVVGPDTTPAAKLAIETAKAQRVPTYSFRPYMDERRVRVVIPAGFTLRSLPPNKTTKLGLATLVEEYSMAEKGVVTADFKFDSGPSTITAEQALAMRDAVLELSKRDYVGISFDQTGAKALAEGQIRKALEADRATIALHPKEALPHVRLSQALLEAGIGDQSFAEGKLAVKLDPKSAVASTTLGWTLQHDSLGERFGKGYDLAGAIAAYKAGIALDPEDNFSRYNLGVLYEFNERGTRYAVDAHLADAEATYKDLIERTKETNPGEVPQYQDNLAYVLVYERKFAELDGLLAEIPGSNARSALAVVSTTAQKGPAAGIARADSGNITEGDRSKNLIQAGKMLAKLRMYPEAAAVLQAGINGETDATATAQQIEMFKTLKPVEATQLPESDPARPVHAMIYGLLFGAGSRKTLSESFSRHAYSSEASMNITLDKNLRGSGVTRMAATKSGFSELVMMDMIAGNVTLTVSGDDESGHTVLAKTLGSQASRFFIVKEDGAYRIAAEDGEFRNVGNEVLYALEHKQEKLAKSLLDWKRDQLHKAGGDDAFAGPLLTRFWTVGSAKEGADSPAAMRLAGISLLAGSMDAKPYLAEIGELRDKATGQRQTDLDLLLAAAASGAEVPDVTLPAAKRLLEQEPDSLVALWYAGHAYAQMGKPESWVELLAPYVTKKPEDRELLSQQVHAYETAHEFAAARKMEQAILDSGKATSADYNNYAWMGLFDDHMGEEELKDAQQSNMLSKNASFSDLHTLACVYAAEGKTTEARQTLKRAMQVANEADPNSAVWYALGLIYEQYGEREAARAAYEKVQAHELDDHTYIEPTATYVLAQARLKALGGK
jgi:tetratricopeptide (TPR) repeat protein